MDLAEFVQQLLEKQIKHFIGVVLMDKKAAWVQSDENNT